MPKARKPKRPKKAPPAAASPPQSAPAPVVAKPAVRPVQRIPEILDVITAHWAGEVRDIHQRLALAATKAGQVQNALAPIGPSRAEDFKTEALIFRELSRHAARGTALAIAAVRANKSFDDPRDLVDLLAEAQGLPPPPRLQPALPPAAPESKPDKEG